MWIEIDTKEKRRLERIEKAARAVAFPCDPQMRCEALQDMQELRDALDGIPPKEKVTR
jgi:hypothetical protein